MGKTESGRIVQHLITFTMTSLIIAGRSNQNKQNTQIRLLLIRSTLIWVYAVFYKGLTVLYIKRCKRDSLGMIFHITPLKRML